jgi:hypothetical protein
MFRHLYAIFRELFYPCELLKVRNCCVIEMYPCTVNVGVHRMLWFRVLLCPAERMPQHKTMAFTMNFAKLDIIFMCVSDFKNGRTHVRSFLKYQISGHGTDVLVTT